MRLQDAAAAVRARIADACASAGRDPREVTLVAVTKGHPPALAAAAFAAGLADLGENRIEDLERKRAGAPAARWHHLGAVQSNKARRIAAAAALVHGLEPGRGAERLAAEGRASGRPVAALLEVDFTPGAGRQGVAPKAVPGALEALRALDGLDLRGLMTVAPLDAQADAARPFFERLRELRDRHAPDLPELSMGMSGDFPVALREGATIVRIGTALFGARPSA